MDHERNADAIGNALAVVLENRRQELRVSQEELAKRAGISRTYVSDIERGLRNISVITLSKLAAALDSTPSSMLKLAENRVLDMQGAQVPMLMERSE